MATEVFTGRGPAIFVAIIVVYSIVTLFILARMVCRIFVVRRLGWDDFFIMLAWSLGLASVVLFGICTHRGLGAHDVDIPEENDVFLRELQYAMAILYYPASGAARISILVFYLYLTKATHRIIHVGSWVVLTIVGVAVTVLFFLSIFQCNPVRAAFGDTAGKCTPMLTLFICSAPINIVVDVAILLLPMPMLTSMKLPLRQKIILISTFSVGIFVTVVAVIRVYYLQQAIGAYPGYTYYTNGDTRIVKDYAYSSILAIFWSCVECYLTIICVSVPTLKPLVIRILPAVLVGPKDHRGSTNRNRSYDSSYTPPLTANRQPSAWAQMQAVCPMYDDDPSSQPQASTRASLQSPQSPLSPQSPQSLRILQSLQSPQNTPSARSSSATLEMSPTVPSPTHISPHHSPCSAPETTAQSTAGAPTTWTDTTVGDGLTASQTQAHGQGQGQNPTNFGFVNVKQRKSMLDMTVRESWKYCSIVSILFFLWGFSYGLLNTLNSIIGTAADITQAQILAGNSIYFGGGYLFGPLLLGGRILRHDERHLRRYSDRDQSSVGVLDWLPASVGHATDGETPGGFKATIITGLVIYGTGAIMFWPCAVLVSFPGFLLSSFVVGFGLSIVETAATPFVVLCGPLEYSEMRLMLAQGLQGMSSVVSGVLAQKVFFVSTEYGAAGQSNDILGVQWTYLAITLCCAALVAFFYYIPLPEVCDVELEKMASKLPVDGNKRTRFFGLRLHIVCLALAVFAQWLYVGAQESVSDFYHDIIVAWLPNLPTPQTDAIATRDTICDTDVLPGMRLSPANFLLLDRIGFAVARCMVAMILYLCVKFPRRWVPAPRTVLLIYISSMALYALLIVCIPPQPNANYIALPLTLFFMAEGAVYPLIFATGLRGQGAYTKQAAMWLTAGTSGPLFWPFVMYGIIRRGGTVQNAQILIVGMMALALVYPLFLIFHRDARQLTAVTKSGLTEEPNSGSESHVQMAQTSGMSGGIPGGIPQRPERPLNTTPDREVDALPLAHIS